MNGNMLLTPNVHGQVLKLSLNVPTAPQSDRLAGVAAFGEIPVHGQVGVAVEATHAGNA